MTNTVASYLRALIEPDKSFYDTLITTGDLSRNIRARDNRTDIISGMINPLKNQLLGKAALYASLTGRPDFYTPNVSRQ